ncbi:MAG: hypothetical protein A2096_11200 [Spirochaetes bacterium GWF1_41_5]|nr:MAG: hypothetical protein A2096_11200 [Spirochaetes bacterium GWF1_41_5]
MQIYFYFIEKAGFIVLFTQEINLHSLIVDKLSLPAYNSIVIVYYYNRRHYEVIIIFYIFSRDIIYAGN